LSCPVSVRRFSMNNCGSIGGYRMEATFAR
jgi:hypothetical protein